MLDIRIIIAIIAAFGLAASYGKGWLDGNQSCKEEYAERALRARDIRDQQDREVSEELERRLFESREYARKLERLVDYEISKNSVYDSCIVPNSGVQLLNNAIKGTTTR